MPRIEQVEAEQTMIEIDAVRFIPPSFTPYQGRIADGTAISISKEEHAEHDPSMTALRFPFAWVVLDKLVNVIKSPLPINTDFGLRG